MFGTHFCSHWTLLDPSNYKYAWTVYKIDIPTNLDICTQIVIFQIVDLNYFYICTFCFWAVFPSQVELAKKEGLPCYKERRAHIASFQACVTSSELPAQKAPSVKSKVTVSLLARSSLSGEGSLVVALDQPSGSEEEVASWRASSCWVVHGCSKGLHLGTMWYPTA